MGHCLCGQEEQQFRLTGACGAHNKDMLAHIGIGHVEGASFIDLQTQTIKRALAAVHLYFRVGFDVGVRNPGCLKAHDCAGSHRSFGENRHNQGHEKNRDDQFCAVVANKLVPLLSECHVSRR